MRQPEYYFEEALHDGINAIRVGNRKLGRTLLERAARMNGADTRVWMWMASTTDDPDEQREFLGRAVAADPGNEAARRGLVMLSGKLDRTRLVKEGQPYTPPQPGPAADTQGTSYLCPNCGGRTAFDIRAQELACPYCGYVQAREKRLAADEAEQMVDYIMPTTRAYNWAQTQQRVTCGQCGAITMLPPRETADRCPYCAANRFVKSDEMMELVDPQVIALIKIDEENAKKKVKAWLGKGLLAPDDLALRHAGLALRPSYYPFWTFDGTLEIPWSCEVNTGSSRFPHWEKRSGTQFEFFDDVLVPGLRAMTHEELERIKPFNLKDLVEFSPDYVVGWGALAYDYPLDKATQRAQDFVKQRFTHMMYTSVESGNQKRNFQAGAGRWSGLTFKNVLLPLWVGTYHYQGQSFRLLVNGQTGKVGGIKPRDNIKLAVLIGICVVLVAMLTALLYPLVKAMIGN